MKRLEHGGGVRQPIPDGRSLATVRAAFAQDMADGRTDVSILEPPILRIGQDYVPMFVFEIDGTRHGFPISAKWIKQLRIDFKNLEWLVRTMENRDRINHRKNKP